MGGSCNKQKDNQQEFAPFSSALCADLSFSVSPCLSAFLLIPIGWLDIFRRVSTCQSTTASVSLCCAVVFKCWECMSKPYPHSPLPPPSSFSAQEQLTIITHCWPRQTVVAQAHWTPLCADKQNQAEPTGCERPALPAPQLQPLLRDHPLRSTIAPQIPPLPHKVLVQVSV